MEPICYIVGAGDFATDSFHPNEGDYVIAADGGYRYLEKLQVVPDMVVGDFDSLEEIPNHPNIVKHSPIKDDTDMLLAVNKGLEAGYHTFSILGGMGNRLDHTLANLQVLSYLSKRKAKGFLVGEEFIITAITNETLLFEEDKRGIISIFSHGNTAEGVTLTGLKYSLTEANVTHDYPIGVSNEFLGIKSSVSVKKGTLLVMWQNFS